MAVEAAFLRAVVPLVVDRRSTSDLPRAAREIAEVARLHGVSTRSLLGLTVLSCLYEDLQGNGYPIGRKILKPKRDYGAKAAYNAISDLRHLELLIAPRLIAPTSTWSLCTCDKALALLWCAASPHDAKLVDGELNFSIVFDERMFPRATTPELKRLATDEDL